MKVTFRQDEMHTLRLPEGRVQQDFFQKLRDGRSLVLTVGRKRSTWSAMYYDDAGKAKRKKVGEWPAMTVKEAKDAVFNFDVKKALATSESGSFEEVTTQFLRRHVDANGLISAPEIRRQLNKYCLPKWGTKPFLEIRRKDVAELLDDLEEQSGRATANAVLATLRKMMNWYEARDENYTSPIVRGMNRGAPVKRQRWLTDDEIKRLWNTLDAADDEGQRHFPKVFAGIVKFLLLSGQRRGKANEMQWDDLTTDDNGKITWRIQRAPREKGVAGTITLPPLAAQIVAAQPRIAGNPFVFSGKGEGSFNSWSEKKALLDELMPLDPPWTFHDLRRTCRRLLSVAKVRTEVAELCLGHVIAGVRGVYDDASAYREEIDEALVAVEGLVTKITESD